MGSRVGSLRRCFRALCTAGLLLCSGPALADPFSFVVLGDQPYGNSEAVKQRFIALIDAINAQDPDLVLHVGDTKSGGARCTDELLAERLSELNMFRAPTLYTPGDNEWTDCHHLVAGGYDPEERLALIRKTYFEAPGTSFGANPITLTHQGAAGYPENARVMLNDIMFVTAHVVGSNNNFEADRPESAVEFAARDAANRDWLTQSFDAAKDARALVLAIHADMFEFDFGPSWSAESFLRHSGFGRFAQTLIFKAGEFQRPVLLVYGDSHKFRMFRPFPKTGPNIVALETFGAKHMHALQIHVMPDAIFPFAVQPLVNPDQPLVRQAKPKD